MTQCAMMQIDLAKLRKLAAVRGLVNNQLRRRVWPLLLGIGTEPDADGPPYSGVAAATHRDTQVCIPEVVQGPLNQGAGS